MFFQVNHDLDLYLYVNVSPKLSLFHALREMCFLIKNCILHSGVYAYEPQNTQFFLLLDFQNNNTKNKPEPNKTQKIKQKCKNSYYIYKYLHSYNNNNKEIM